MKHQKAIEAAFANSHASWMSADDKFEMNQEVLKVTGKTMEQLDAEIETGVQNGYSVETQLELVKRLYANGEALRPKAERSNAFFTSDVSETVDYVLDQAAMYNDRKGFVAAVMEKLKPWRENHERI